MAVYLVMEKGWEKVWSGDTTDMYYGYYPLPPRAPVTHPSASDGVQEEKDSQGSAPMELQRGTIKTSEANPAIRENIFPS